MTKGSFAEHDPVRSERHMLSRHRPAEPGGEDGHLLVELTDDTFLNATIGAWTVVDFWAPWCAPCKRFAPTFGDAARRYGTRIRFATLNVDAAPGAAELLQVRTIPTVVLFDPDGNEAGRVVNPPPGAFAKMIEDVVTAKGL